MKLHEEHRKQFDDRKKSNQSQSQPLYDILTVFLIVFFKEFNKSVETIFLHQTLNAADELELCLGR